MAQMTKQSIGKRFSSTRMAAFATVISGAALLAAGCTAMAGSNGSAPAAAAALQSAQQVPAGVAVSCAAGQQTLVRQAIVAGQPAVQVECVPGAATATAGAVAPQSGFASTQPAWTSSAAVPVATVPVRSSPAVYRPVSDDEIVYQPRARRVERPSGRSWQKSAVIIGSSAGIGAGVGAAVGGKKGALIGAALGGGSAAIWDQVTRRR
jgi:hypothetical protein